MSQCAKFAGKQVSDCTRGEFCICAEEMKQSILDKIDAERWRKFISMPNADQEACLSKNKSVTVQCVDDYRIIN